MHMRRHNKILAAIATLLSVSIGHAQQPSPGAALEDPAWLKAFVHKRIVYAVLGMERVKVRKDLTYKRVNNAELKADVYSPVEPAGGGARRPAVIFIHGGRVPPNLLTTPKDWGVYKSFGQLAAASGFVGVTFNHRFYAWESLSDSQADVMDLIAYVRDNAETLGVDPERLTLWAFSAGGLFLSRPLREANSYIKCLGHTTAYSIYRT